MSYDPDSIEPCHRSLHPYTELAARIRADPEYAWAWHCVAACAALDHEIDPVTANRIASRIMRIMFDVETQHPDGPKAVGGYHDPTKLAQFPRRTLWDQLKEL